MNLEELYQTIGHLALSNAPGLHGQLVVYAEVQDGVVSAGMFYEMDTVAGRTVAFRFCPEELENAVYELWERWQEVPGNQTWFSLAYLVRDNKMQVDLMYPESLVEGDGHRERRRRVVEKYFGDAKVDFSKPKG